MRFQNGCNKVVIELCFVQFWSEIILVISNRNLAARSFDFEITRMISDQIALHSVQLPLYTHPMRGDYNTEALIFKMAATRILDVSKEETSKMKENEFF